MKHRFENRQHRNIIPCFRTMPLLQLGKHTKVIEAAHVLRHEPSGTPCITLEEEESAPLLVTYWQRQGKR